MKTIDEKKNKNRKYPTRLVFKRHKILKRRRWNCMNKNLIPNAIEGIVIDDGDDLVKSFKAMRKGFLKAGIERGEISKDNPIAKKFLED